MIAFAKLSRERGYAAVYASLGGSPFNIKSASLTLHNFTAQEVTELYQQHTDETSQIFTPEANTRAYW